MSAFAIALVSIKNPEKFQEYAKAAGPTFAAFNAKHITKGKNAGTLCGASSHQMAAIFEFPDVESAQNWYNSDAYQAIIPLRDEACDVTITIHAAA